MKTYAIDAIKTYKDGDEEIRLEEFDDGYQLVHTANQGEELIYAKTYRHKQDAVEAFLAEIIQWEACFTDNGEITPKSMLALIATHIRSAFRAR